MLESRICVIKGSDAGSVSGVIESFVGDTIEIGMVIWGVMTESQKRLLSVGLTNKGKQDICK